MLVLVIVIVKLIFLTSKVEQFLSQLDDSSSKERHDDKSKKCGQPSVMALQPFEFVVYFKGQKLDYSNQASSQSKR